MRPPLLLTGPAASGKTTTARALARARPRAAVIDVDDIRHLVVAGHAAPWEGGEGLLQQRIGVENACDCARRFFAAGIEPLLADVATAETVRVYRRHLPNLQIVRLQLSLDEVRRRAARRPAHLSDAELEALHAGESADAIDADQVIAVGHLSEDEQVAAVLRVWAGADPDRS